MSQPELLKFALDRRVKQLGWTRKLDGGKVMAIWNEVVGPQVAGRAQPDSFSGGSLTVVVQESAWRYQLSLSKEVLLTQLNTALGRNVVKDLFFVAFSRRKDY